MPSLCPLKRLALVFALPVLLVTAMLALSRASFAATVSASIVNPTLISNTATFDEGRGALRASLAAIGVNAYDVFLPLVLK